MRTLKPLRKYLEKNYQNQIQQEVGTMFSSNKFVVFFYQMDLSKDVLWFGKRLSGWCLNIEWMKYVRKKIYHWKNPKGFRLLMRLILVSYTWIEMFSYFLSLFNQSYTLFTLITTDQWIACFLNYQFTSEKLLTN